MLRISKAALFAAALFAFAPQGGFAQDVQLSVESPSSEAPPPSGGDSMFEMGFTTNVSVPTVTAVNSSMDEAALRDVLNGGFMKHVSDIAALTADSITIPEITVTTTTTSEGKTTTSAFSYRDIVLNNVKAGVAESVAIGSTDSANDEVKILFGKSSAKEVDFGGLLAIFGLVDGAKDQPIKTLYKDYVFEGGTVTGEKVNCTFGPTTPASFGGRPLAVSFTQFMDAAKQLDAAKDSEPPAEAIGTVARFVADALKAFESTASEVGAISCSGTGDDGKPFSIGVDKIATKGNGAGVYNGIALDGLKVTGEQDGVVSLGHVEVKAVDFNAPISAVESAAMIDKAWFDANARKLIPSWSGFAFSDLVIDVPSPSPEMGQRAKLSIANFDLSMSDYINGIPSKLSTSGSGIMLPLPQDSADPQIAMLLALGMTEINVGFDVQLGWDRDSKSIKVDKVAFNGANLASIAMGANIINAAETIFDPNPEIAQIAALGVALHDFTLNFVDDGLGDILAPLAAEPQDKTVADVRTRLAGVAAGSVLQLLGSTEETQALAQAVGNFVAGQAKSLQLNLVAKDEAGIPIPAFMQAGENPALLAQLVTITGTAQ